MSKSNPDTLITEKIRDGDKEATTEFLEKYNNKIKFWIQKRIGFHKEDVDDLAQDAMMAVLQSLMAGKFDINKGISLDSYVYGITLNKMKDYFRYLKREEKDISPISVEQTSKEAEISMDKDIRRQLQAKLGTLPRKYKDVLYLRFYKEYSIAEISILLGIPKRRVSERINYGIKMLKKIFEAEDLF